MSQLEDSRDWASSPETPMAIAPTQNGASDRKMYPALVKNLRMESGET